MKHIKHFLSALTLSATCSAFAGPYIGGDYALIDADIVDLGALVFKGGYQLTDWAAIEARVGFGLQDDDYYGIDVELDNFFGGYFLAGLPNTSIFYPYVIAGYTRMEIDVSGYGVSDSADDSDFSYGIGSRITITESLAGNVEFMRYFDDGDGDIDAINFGLIFKF